MEQLLKNILNEIKDIQTDIKDLKKEVKFSNERLEITNYIKGDIVKINTRLDYQLTEIANTKEQVSVMQVVNV